MTRRIIIAIICMILSVSKKSLLYKNIFTLNSIKKDDGSQEYIKKLFFTHIRKNGFIKYDTDNK